MIQNTLPDGTTPTFNYSHVCYNMRASTDSSVHVKKMVIGQSIKFRAGFIVTSSTNFAAATPLAGAAVTPFGTTDAYTFDQLTFTILDSAISQQMTVIIGAAAIILSVF